MGGIPAYPAYLSDL